MRVLITGSTSPQASVKTAGRTPTFASLLSHSLISQGIEVDFVEPRISTTEEQLAEYDAVFVGIAPPTSLSANRLYPAFATANRARKAGNLFLFIDAPEPYKIQSSIKSCYLNISDLQKDFYKMRKFYPEFIEDEDLQREVYDFIDFLYTSTWPPLLYPAFPWSEDDALRKALPNVNVVVPVNLDSTLIKTGHINADLSVQKTSWTCDTPNTKWAKKLSKTLSYPVFSTRKSRWDPEEVTMARIRGGIGTIVSLHRSNEVWWSPALAQSLSVGVPVVTDWRYSGILGPEWSHLASSIESMTNEERFELAVSQRDFYLGAVDKRKIDLDSIFNNN
jgi:hypothetical protein